MKRSLFLSLAIVIATVAPCFSMAAPAYKDPPSATRTLTGHVLNRQDEPVSKALVYLKNTKTLVIKTYITDPDGSYRFPALSTNVDYEVYAEHQRARSDTKTLSAFDSRKAVNITLRLK
jgi:hypothetical protein